MIFIGGPETQLAGTLLRIKICGTLSSRLVEACVQADTRGGGPTPTPTSARGGDKMNVCEMRRDEVWLWGLVTRRLSCWNRGRGRLKKSNAHCTILHRIPHVGRKLCGVRNRSVHDVRHGKPHKTQSRCSG